MARCTIRPSRLQGSITPPPSHSQALHLIWGIAFGDGGAIGNVPSTPDVEALLNLSRQLGADPVFSKNTADIDGAGIPDIPPSISCGNSKMVQRLALPLCCFHSEPVAIRGPPIPAGPSRWLDDAAAEMGVRITKMSDHVLVRGPPTGEALTLKGRAGAYWAPGFIMSLPLAQNELLLIFDEFSLNHPATRRSLAALDMLKILYTLEEKERSLTIPAEQPFLSRYSDVEADWCTGSYLLGALLLAGSGEVALSSFSNQPERAFWKSFETDGGPLHWSPDGLSVRVKKSQPLPNPEEWDVGRAPALLPLAMVLACAGSRPSRVGPLRHLPPSALRRAHILAEELGKLGVDIKIGDLWIDIVPTPLSGGNVDCRNDGRIAMVLGLAGLAASAPLTIENAQAVAAIHTGFWNDLRSLGASAQVSFSKEAPKAEPAKKETPENELAATRKTIMAPRASAPVRTPPPPISPENPVNDGDWHSI